MHMDRRFSRSCSHVMIGRCNAGKDGRSLGLHTSICKGHPGKKTLERFFLKKINKRFAQSDSLCSNMNQLFAHWG